MELTDSDDALVHIRLGIRIRLMQHTFIAFACGSWLIGIDSGNQDDLIRNLFFNSVQSGDILQNGLTVISRTRANYQNEFIRASIKDCLDILSLHLVEWEAFCEKSSA